MSNDMMGMTIAVSILRDKIPKDSTLEDRLAFSMRYVRKHESDLFWMFGRVDDDMKSRTAIAAVMVEASAEEKDRIERSLKPLRMLAAAVSGIPVDFAALDLAEDNLPLIKLWNESGATP